VYENRLGKLRDGGTLGNHRYTRLLGGMDLSKVIHAYGTMDEAIIGVKELLRKLDLQ